MLTDSRLELVLAFSMRFVRPSVLEPTQLMLLARLNLSLILETASEIINAAVLICLLRSLLQCSLPLGGGKSMTAEIRSDLHAQIYHPCNATSLLKHHLVQLIGRRSIVIRVRKHNSHIQLASNFQSQCQICNFRHFRIQRHSPH